MKKVITIILCASLFIPSVARAQSTDSVNKQIDSLKNKVASKVAQLKLVQKKGVVGAVTEVSTTHITINDINNNSVGIDVDELTEFSSSDNRNFDISDIKKGMTLSILGLYNKDSQRLLARFVDETTLPVFLQGVVSGKDSKDFTLTLSTADGKSYLIDIEDVTKTLSFSTGDLDSVGFSKLDTMVNAVVIGFPDKKEKDRITAARVIIFPNVPKNPKIQIKSSTITTSPSPTP